MLILCFNCSGHGPGRDRPGGLHTDVGQRPQRGYSPAAEISRTAQISTFLARVATPWMETQAGLQKTARMTQPSYEKTRLAAGTSRKAVNGERNTIKLMFKESG